MEEKSFRFTVLLEQAQSTQEILLDFTCPIFVVTGSQCGEIEVED